MIDEEHRELIHAGLDGELPEASRAMVSSYLLANPEARDYVRDMQRVCHALDGLPRVPAPPGLREAIMDRVASAAAAVPVPVTRRAPWVPATVLRYAAAFVAGVLVSALAFHAAVDTQSELATSDLVGTMAQSGRVAPASPVDSVRLELDQLRGEVTLYDAGSTLLLEFDLTAEQPVDVVAVYDGGEARLRGGAGTPQEGRQHYALALSRQNGAPASVALQFFVDGVLVHEDGLETERDR